MARLPLFPLGTVLLPTGILPLHVFEPRYRAMMEDLADPPGGADVVGGELGVVLISRGSEVGGGDERVGTGTVARIMEASRQPDGRWLVLTVGTRRFRVDAWLPEDPYPVGEVTELDEAEPWRDEDSGLLADAERAVRRALALAAELGQQGMPVTFELSSDPRVAAWQIPAMAPLGPLDRQRLLEADDPADRLRTTLALAGEVADLLALRLAGGQ